MACWVVHMLLSEVLGLDGTYLPALYRHAIVRRVDIVKVMAALREFTEAEPPTTKPKVKTLVDAITESGIGELSEWVESLSEQISQASGSIEDLSDADRDDREEYFATASSDVAEVLSLLADITPSS